MARTPTPTRMYAPQGIGMNQEIHDIKYATRTIAAGVIPTTTNFFGAAPSADMTVDRYEQGNTIVSSGKQFTIYGIAAQVFAGAAAILTDLEKLINFTCIRIVTAQKEFGVYPTLMLPAMGGLSLQSGQVAVTPAAAPGGLSVVGAVNGMPDRRAGFNLAFPLVIGANQGFYCELIGPVTTTQTLTGAVIVRLVLDGVEQRVAS